MVSPTNLIPCFTRNSHEVSCSDTNGLIADTFTLKDVFLLIPLGCSYVMCVVITIFVTSPHCLYGLPLNPACHTQPPDPSLLFTERGCVLVARVHVMTAAQIFPKIIFPMSLCLLPKLWHWLNKQVMTRRSRVLRERETDKSVFERNGEIKK